MITERRLRSFVPVIAMGFVAFAASLAIPVADQAASPPRTTTVPNVVGMTDATAWADLLRHEVCETRVTLKITGRTSNPRAQPRVTKQTPAAGAHVKIRGSVSLVEQGSVYSGALPIVIHFTGVVNPPVSCPLLPKTNLVG